MTKSADILAALAEAPCTAPEIARRLGMDPDAVSATLCVLQRGGRAVRLRGRVRMAGPIPAVRWSLPGPEDIEVAPPRRGEPPPVRTNGAEKAGLSGRKSGFSKETKPVTVAPKDARRPSFGGVGCLGLTGAVDLNYRPDPPPEKRGVVLKTAELMGDPTPEQRARMAATPGQAVRTPARWR